MTYGLWKIVMEVGCGCALPCLSLLIAQSQISDFSTASIVASDRDEKALDNLQCSLTLNIECESDDDGSINIQMFDWMEESSFKVDLFKNVDVILISDLLYEAESSILLARWIGLVWELRNQDRCRKKDETSGNQEDSKGKEEEHEKNELLTIYVVSPPNRRGYDSFTSEIDSLGFSCIHNDTCPSEFLENPLENDPGNVGFDSLFFRFATDVFKCLKYVK